MYAAALDEYVARHAADEVTETMNRVLDEVGSQEDPFVTAAAEETLRRVEW